MDCLLSVPKSCFGGFVRVASYVYHKFKCNKRGAQKHQDMVISTPLECYHIFHVGEDDAKETLAGGEEVLRNFEVLTDIPGSHPFLDNERTIQTYRGDTELGLHIMHVRDAFDN